MSFSLQIKRFGALPAMLAAMGLGLAPAYAGGQVEKIKFSDPGIALVTSNLTENAPPGLNRLNPTPNALKQVQEDLFRPLTDSMKEVNSMNGVLDLPPPPQPEAPSASSKRARAQRDRARNWAFTGLNDLFPEPSAEEALGVKNYDADGREKGSETVIERFLEAGQQHGATNRNGLLEAYGFTGVMMTNSYGVKDPNLAAQFNFLKAKNPFAPQDNDAEAGAFANGFSFLSKSQEAQAQQQHNEEFRRLLDPSLPPVKGPSNPYLTGIFTDPLRSSSGLFGGDQQNNSATQPAVAAHRNLTGPLKPADPTAAAFHSRVFDNPTDAALGLPTPPAAKTAPAPVTAESVQALLNPYAATVKRPSF